MSSKVIYKIKRKWRTIKLLESLLFSSGAWLFTFGLLNNVISGIEVIALLTASIALVFWIQFSGIFKINNVDVARFISKSCPQVQNGTELLVADVKALNSVEKVQRDIVEKLISTIAVTIPVNWKMPVISLFLGLMVFVFGNFISLNKGNTNLINNDLSINEFKVDTKPTPEIKSLQVKIIPPSYSGLKSVYQSRPSIRALEFSIISWQLEFSSQVDSANIILSDGRKIKLVENDDFMASYQVNFNNFYHFEFYNQSKITTTELYEIRVNKDESPIIELKNRDPFQEFDYGSISSTIIQATIKDDFGINQAKIIATVAKGSGESVKFRETEIPFETNFRRGSIAIDLMKSINLDSLNLGPGDELYFYIIALDNRLPEPNVAKSETYFVSFRDTSEIEFSLVGNLGVDLMPEYFRSQRQIIIDTEKLIKSKPSISSYNFNFTSNELGFDQKVLRLKYGQFMGEEFVSEAGGGTEDLVLEEHNDSEDQLAEYTHAHDTENDHNLLEVNNIGEELGHSHDNADENTYFSMSVRTKLKEAMSQMWDAELYLRLYQPKKSLPYQYRALKLIKEIKNHARIYVQRMGFDPPPIKILESRLKGKALDDVVTSRARNTYEFEEFAEIHRLLQKINEYFKTKETIHYTTWQNAGNELAPLAIEEPGKFFSELNAIQQFRDGKVENYEIELVRLYQNLGALMPSNNSNGGNYALSKWNLELTKQLKLEE